MMKLTGCSFDGLEAFGCLELNNLKQLTCLIGPNGAGKSSILQILKFTFEVLSRKTLSDTLGQTDNWHVFSRATLKFNETGTLALQHFGGFFQAHHGDISIELEIADGQFSIRHIKFGESQISFQDWPVPLKTLAKHNSELASFEDQKQNVEKELKTPMQPHIAQNPNLAQQDSVNRQNLQRRLEDLNRSILGKKDEIARQSIVTVLFSDAEREQQFDRSEVDDFLTALRLPEVVLVNANQIYENAIPSLVTQLLALKKGREKANRHFDNIMARARHLVQAAVEVSDVEGKEEMHINGIHHTKASAGTQISLAFFSLTRQGESNLIVLWDEPENGLHPTRRARLIELMFNDERQFILATHAMEFAPIHSDKGRVFRCEAIYDSDNDATQLSIHLVANRRDAFDTLEALGVHPAQTLFTANAVIWVEGPTELLFFRHWLTPRLEHKGLHEGFHFTYMQYGGALLSYLEVADDAQFASTFDLLSVCRRPVIIVDSDLKENPGEKTPSQFLKKGANRIREEVESLNTNRPEAALFAWTSGREVENYLPEEAIWYAVSQIWQGYESHASALRNKSFEVGKYDSYDGALEKHFIESNVVNAAKEGAKVQAGKAIGITCWGATNKVEMMREALNMPLFTEAQLKWECSSLLQRIEDFIVSTSKR